MHGASKKCGEPEKNARSSHARVGAMMSLSGTYARLLRTRRQHPVTLRRFTLLCTCLGGDEKNAVFRTGELLLWRHKSVTDTPACHLSTHSLFLIRARASLCSEETERFEAFMAKLNTEIAIRNDFVTLALEAVRTMPSAELQGNFVSWVDNSGFIGCITTDPRLCSVKDIKPLRLQLLKGGVIGMLDLPVVQEYYEKVCLAGDKTPRHVFSRIAQILLTMRSYVSEERPQEVSLVRGVTHIGSPPPLVPTQPRALQPARFCIFGGMRLCTSTAEALYAQPGVRAAFWHEGAHAATVYQFS